MLGSPIALLYTVPAAHTKEGKERLRAYYEALGRFVDMFARVETAITLTLWHYAKTTPEIAKIVFAGTKVEGGSTYIKQLAAATNATQELQDDLTDVLQQVGIINGVRNRILHYGATSVAEGNAVVSDALKAKGQPESFPISPISLGQMTRDLIKIVAHLNELHLMSRSEHTLAGSPLYAAWQYKHSLPTPSRTSKPESRRPLKRGPKPPGPRPSSRG